MKYLPTRENFENFLSSLIPYTATFDPALAGLIREVSNTHAPDLTVIQRWEDALGFAGMSLLFTILVSKCNMSLDLLNYFPKETITASNGLSILQMLCAATLRYTLHTLDMYVQKFLQPDSCSTAHNLRDCLVEHETRVQQLNSLGFSAISSYSEFLRLELLNDYVLNCLSPCSCSVKESGSKALS